MVCEMLAITTNYVCSDQCNVLSVNHSYHKYENGHEKARVCLMVITAEKRELGWLVKVPKSFKITSVTLDMFHRLPIHDRKLSNTFIGQNVLSLCASSWVPSVTCRYHDIHYKSRINYVSREKKVFIYLSSMI